MIKGLEALGSLKFIACIEAGFTSKLITYAEEMKHNKMVEEKYNIVKKELKALEIIKKTKNIEVYFFDNGKRHYRIKFDRTREQEVSQEEYKLLKEVLENES